MDIIKDRNTYSFLLMEEAFWETVLPLYRDICPEQDAAAFVKQLNRVIPTAIRIEADEVTYPLHILIRYELEKEINVPPFSFDAI